MTTISVSQFKTHALALFGRVADKCEKITITKRGKPIARIIPYEEEHKKPIPGKLSDFVIFEKDIVSPLGPEMWDATAENEHHEEIST